jgi:hypothetical protein
MARCTSCNSSDADPDIGLCFACFCGDDQYPEPTEAEYCESLGHPEYENAGRCYCGAKGLRSARPAGEGGAMTRLLAIFPLGFAVFLLPYP